MDVDGYTWFGFNRTVKHRNAPKTFGGIGLLVRDSIYNEFRISTIDKSFEGILGVKFVKNDADVSFIVYCCYLPPDNSPYGRNATDFFGHLITQMYINSEVNYMFFCGDINGRIGDLSDVVDVIDNLPSRKSIDHIKQGHCDAMIDFLHDGKVCVLNGRLDPEKDNFTYISDKGKSVVDYIMVPHDCYANCKSFQVMTMSDIIDRYSLQSFISERCKPPDHSLLVCHFTLEHYMIHSENDMEETELNSSKVKYRFDRAPDLFMSSDVWKSGVRKMIEHCISIQKSQEEVDKLYTEFNAMLLEEMDEYVKYTSASTSCRKRLKNHKPYWNDELLELWKNMNKAEKEFCACNGSRRQRSLKRELYMAKREHFDKALRQAERKYNLQVITDIENVCTNNPREFWKHVKSLGPRKSNKVPLKVYENGVLTNNLNDVLYNWKHEFETLYNRPMENMNDQEQQYYERIQQTKINRENEMSYDGYVENEFINGDITLTEIEHITQKLKNNKSSGFDKIPNEVLKNADVQNMLWKLFNTFFQLGMTPTIWLKTIIVPIPKSATKDPHVPLNYRGISLLSCVLKAYSGILNKRVTDYCELMEIFSDEQNGFRKDRSCVDHIFTVTSVVRNRMSNNLPTFACFIDMQKAFDWVDRDLLMYKMLMHNIDGKVYHAIKALYSHPISCIKINDKYTEWFPTTSGVKQGDCLSPTMFGIFINDLVTDLKSLGIGVKIVDEIISILLFADDIILLAESEEDLQKMLDCTNEWCKKWKMFVNKDKTKIVHFRNKRKPQTMYKFLFDESELEIVSQYKYLGIILTEHLDFNGTADVLAGGAGRALGAIISKFKYFRNIGHSTFTKLFDTSVIPIIEYGAEVWGYKKYTSCEKVQNRAIRYFMGVHPKTPIPALNGDMGWIATDVRRHNAMIRYWNRLMNMNNERITKKVFIWDKSLCKENWSSEVKCLLSSAGMIECFNFDRLCDVELFKTRKTELFTEEWKLDVSNKPKLRTYSLFKHTLELDQYVKCTLSRRQRSLFAQFRMGILPLHIETGRFRGLDVEERLCQVCNSGEIEDEIHFLCKCNKYNNIRNRLFRNVDEQYNVWNVTDKFVYLVKSKWRQASKFICEAWNVRQNHLYN